MGPPASVYTEGGVLTQGGFIAEPGLDPTGRRTAGPLFAAFYGRLDRHTWRDAELRRAAHALFYERSLSMGWLDDRAACGGPGTGIVRAPGLWAINDAGWDHPLAKSDAGLVAWFQVEASEVVSDRPLPVRPLLKCAEDATARAGRLTLSAIQLLLPVNGIAASARPAYAPVPSILTVGWFAECDPNASTQVNISLMDDEGYLADDTRARQLMDDLGQLGQDVFGVRSFSVTDHTEIRPDGFWNEAPLPGMMAPHGLTLRGQLAEWSSDAVGWVAEVISDLLARQGLRSPLLLTAARTSVESPRS